MNTFEQLQQLPLETILSDVWPNTLCLMRDHNWIAFWDETPNETAYNQKFEGESFREFVCRVIADIIDNYEATNPIFETVVTDFALAMSRHENKQATVQ
jgi:hypothetical protein